jgi:hypothetical protein
VAKQLDALKNDAALSQPVRRFLGKGLDACGPAGGVPLLLSRILAADW